MFRNFEKKDILWISKIYKDISVNNPYLRGIILEKNKKMGFILYEDIYDRAEIDYIYIFPKYQNKKYGSKILSYLIKVLNDRKNITLEVNVNNEFAIKLYKKYGFKIISIRKKYYKNEDGYLMIREM